MKAGGYDMSQYASELTVIHNTIKRMDGQGEINPRYNQFGGFDGWTLKPSLILVPLPKLAFLALRDSVVAQLEELLHPKKK